MYKSHQIHINAYKINDNIMTMTKYMSLNFMITCVGDQSIVSVVGLWHTIKVMCANRNSLNMNLTNIDAASIIYTYDI